MKHKKSTGTGSEQGTMEGLEAHDLGRDFIYPFLQKQALLQNCPIEGQRFAFPVFDGFPIQMEQVNVFPVGNADEIIYLSKHHS